MAEKHRAHFHPSILKSPQQVVQSLLEAFQKETIQNYTLHNWNDVLNLYYYYGDYLSPKMRELVYLFSENMRLHFNTAKPEIIAVYKCGKYVKVKTSTTPLGISKESTMCWGHLGIRDEIELDEDQENERNYMYNIFQNKYHTYLRSINTRVDKGKELVVSGSFALA